MYRNFDNIYVVIVIFSEFKVHLTLIENYVHVELLNKLIIYPGLSRLNEKKWWKAYKTNTFHNFESNN